ncbi:MAG: XdhC family protein [Proteobacteria bacterium]|nr:XdhC family protein [Pseudomonadota bacterium]
MLVEIAPLWEVYLSHKKMLKPMVLSTIVTTKGSSYKKRGAMMLVADDGSHYGLLSGGCLEADIAEHSQQVFQDGQAKLIEYDLSDDSIFGLGMGCDGSIQVLLQLIKDDYAPFGLLNPNKNHAEGARLFINHLIHPTVKLGDYFYQNARTEKNANPNIAQLLKQDLLKPIEIKKPPKVIIIGAGTDTLPLCQMIANLYWHGYSVDHRPMLLASHKFPEKWNCLCFHDHQSKQQLAGFEFDAVIIMSHNINRDAAFLKYFAQSKTAFIGLLGPPNRRDKVLAKAGIKPADLARRLHAPVGLNLGGRLPENVAVSIVAQLQQHFFKTDSLP